MHRLAVGKDDHAQPASSGFVNSPPATYPAIGLFALVLWVRDYLGNPGFADSRAVAPASNDVEVFRRLHVLDSQRPVALTDDSNFS